ncbi:MAG: hypothetical protein ACLGGX_00370 [Bdellovibrionia bacterium]
MSVVFAVSNAQTNDDFQQGLRYFQENNLNSARDSFLKSKEADFLKTESYINLALIELKEQNKGPALGYLRKSLTLAPQDSRLKEAIHYAEKKLGYQVIPPSLPLGLDATLRTLPQDYLLLAIWLLMTVFIILISRHLKLRKQAQEKEMPPPSLGPIIWTTTLFLVSLVILTAWSGYYNYQVRATVMTATIELRATPKADDLVLETIGAGEEVLFIQEQNGWRQFRTRDGNGGWAPANAKLIYY